MGWRKRWGTRTNSYVLPLLATAPLILNTASLPLGNVAPQVPAQPVHRVAEASLAAVATGDRGPSAPGQVALPGQDGRPSTVTVTSPKGPRNVSESAPGVHDIPAAASRAYQRAAAVLLQVDPGCQIPWTLLAAIGRIESDHGRYGGAVLGTDGVSSPLIIGVPLNGVGDVAAIRDTDGGRWDGDPTWDRAVGPMQFIPSTWAAAGVDGDGDGVRNPNDLDDAALAAAVYLCSDTSHLLEPDNMRTAVLRYNNSSSYVSLVMAYEHSYRTGDFTVLGPTSTTPGVAGVDLTTAPTDQVSTSAAAAVKNAAKHKTDHATKGHGKHKKDKKPGHGKKPGPSGKPTGKPTGKPAGSDPGTTPGPGNGTTGPPTTDDPTTDDPTTDDPTTDDPTPEDPPPTTVLTDVSGIWQVCGENDASFCLDTIPDDGLDGNLLLLGEPDRLALPAAVDFDGDGAVETNGEEFAGLDGVDVTLTVEQQPEGGWVVHRINTVAYLLDVTPAPAS